MRTTIQTILSTLILCVYGFAFVGCSGSSSTTPAVPVASVDQDDHDHDDHGHDHDDHDHADGDHDHGAEGHDHDDHAGHDHPAHGPNGGHMVDLSGGAHAEWAHDDESELITVYPENPDAVTKVAMKTTIAEKETVYEFEKKEADGKTTYQLTSPELLTAVKMGEAVDTKLVITTAEGEVVGQVKHHAH